MVGTWRSSYHWGFWTHWHSPSQIYFLKKQIVFSSSWWNWWAWIVKFANKKIGILCQWGWKIKQKGQARRKFNNKAILLPHRPDVLESWDKKLQTPSLDQTPTHPTPRRQNLPSLLWAAMQRPGEPTEPWARCSWAQEGAHHSQAQTWDVQPSWC